MRQLRSLIRIAVSVILFSVFLSFEESPKAAIEWEFTSIDFGEIPFDKPIKAEFSFKNPGMIPLLITEVKPSCGCTVADFPKQPIVSGSIGMISITFDAKTEGYFSKSISVYSNAGDGITELYIKGTVVK
jgi:hypothetical protein